MGAVKVAQIYQLARDTGMLMLDRARCLQLTIFVLVLRNGTRKKRTLNSCRGFQPPACLLWSVWKERY